MCQVEAADGGAHGFTQVYRHRARSPNAFAEAAGPDFHQAPARTRAAIES
jgi:hypothetical protein